MLPEIVSVRPGDNVGELRQELETRIRTGEHCPVIIYRKPEQTAAWFPVTDFRNGARSEWAPSELMIALTHSGLLRSEYLLYGFLQLYDEKIIGVYGATDYYARDYDDIQATILLHSILYPSD